MTESQLEQKLRERCVWVRITYDGTKKRPWRVAIYKCKKCRELFVGATKEQVLSVAWGWVRVKESEK